MTARNSTPTPVPCLPWCTNVDCASDHPVDRHCMSDCTAVPDAVVIHDVNEVPGGGAYVLDEVRTALFSSAPGGPTRVMLNEGDDTYLLFTPDGARRLAAALMARADEAEARR